jgi:signal transduction histidine kinase
LQVVVDCTVEGDFFADAALVHQALLNLATNALEAAPAGGTVALSAQLAADSDVEFSVQNSGPAIPGPVQARLFEPFFTTKPRGTGLGLAISRKIARAHGGDLQLLRNETDRVRFTLTLPSRES